MLGLNAAGGCVWQVGSRLSDLVLFLCLMALMETCASDKPASGRGLGIQT